MLGAQFLTLLEHLVKVLLN